jgi:creatinine amidohydrolase
MNSHVLYAELTPEEFRERITKAPIAYLPLGTLEWHGEHLPLGSDGMQSQGFFVRLAQEVGGIVLPMLFLGPDRRDVVQGKDFYGMDTYGFPESSPHQLTGSAYWISNDLFQQMVEAILKQLARAGFKIVVGHGHGPSAGFFREHIPGWSGKYGLQLFICWRDRTEEADGLGIQTDHAAANETSLMMALHPDLVRMQNLPSDLGEWPVAVSGKDPRTEASAERGEQAIRLQVARMAAILRDAMSRG